MKFKFLPLNHLIYGLFSLVLSIGPAAHVLAQLRSNDQSTQNHASVNQLPNLGDTASDDLSPAEERRIGEEVMREIRAASDDLDDAETSEYLQQLGASLVSHTPAEAPHFDFFILKDPTINAFALPGGFIGIHTGLVIGAQSEAELASVLGHEMGHVLQRHIARSIAQQKQSSLISLGSLMLAILAAHSGNSQVMQAAAMSGESYAIQNQLSFSRDAEREADRVGVQILQDAGFDPGAMVTFFGRLQQASRYDENSAQAYLRTHPLTSERIADIQNRLRSRLPSYPSRSDNLDFQLIRARVRVLQDDSSVQGLRDAQAWFNAQLASEKNNSAALHYGLALTFMLQNKLADAKRALALVQQQRKQADPLVEKLAIDLQQLAGDTQGALALAQAAYQRFSQSRMLALSYANALQQAGRHNEAIRFLRDQITMYRSQAKLYALIAKSYAAQGNTLLMHKSLAENDYLRGDWRAALEQLQIARRSGKDFYELSQIDVRIREIQALILERERRDRANRKA